MHSRTHAYITTKFQRLVIIYFRLIKALKPNIIGEKECHISGDTFPSYQKQKYVIIPEKRLK